MAERMHYAVGYAEDRPWGKFVVTSTDLDANDKGSCGKDITVKSGKILSLQSHDERAELWTVKSGELTVVVDDKRQILKAGQSVHIPVQAIHCMANLTGQSVVVSEVQTGVCREDDIRRYVDANGRKTEPLTTPNAQASVKHYNDIVAEIGRMGSRPAAPRP